MSATLPLVMKGPTELGELCYKSFNYIFVYLLCVEEKDMCACQSTCMKVRGEGPTM